MTIVPDNSYLEGNVVIAQGIFRDPALVTSQYPLGTPIDPTEVVCVWEITFEGVVQTFEDKFGDPGSMVLNPSVGTYTRAMNTIGHPGRWNYEFASAQTGQAAGEKTFWVQARTIPLVY